MYEDFHLMELVCIYKLTIAYTLNVDIKFLYYIVLQNELFVIAGPGAPSVFNCVRICSPCVFNGFSS